MHHVAYIMYPAVVNSHHILFSNTKFLQGTVISSCIGMLILPPLRIDRFAELLSTELLSKHFNGACQCWRFLVIYWILLMMLQRLSVKF